MTEWKQSKAIKRGVLTFAKSSEGQQIVFDEMDKLNYLRGWEIPCRDYALKNKVKDM